MMDRIFVFLKMSRNKIHAYFHIVFATKHREPLISSNKQSALYKMIWDKCWEIDCEPVMINGMEDHIHLLLNANPSVAISKTVKDIKGSSSRWLNKNVTFVEPFSWQRGYGLFTVSPKDVPMIAAYIQNQKEHHRKNSILKEFETE